MILLYHLVFPDTTPSDAWNAGLVLRLKDFKRQLLWLKRYYRIVSLDDYVEHVSRLGKPEPRLAAVTFDDCYSHTFRLVSPFLEGNDIPATFLRIHCTSRMSSFGLCTLMLCVLKRFILNWSLKVYVIHSQHKKCRSAAK